MLFLDGVYVDDAHGSSVRFQWTKAPTSAEFTQLAHTIAHRVGRFLEYQGLLERDSESSYLADDAAQAGPLDQLLGTPSPTASRWARIRAARWAPSFPLRSAPLQ